MLRSRLLSFRGDGCDRQGLPPLRVILTWGNRRLVLHRRASERALGGVQFYRTFTTGWGPKWITVRAEWADGTTSVVRRFLALRWGRRPSSPYVRDYAFFLRRNEPTARDVQELARTVAALPEQPLVSVLMPTYNTPPRFLEKAIQSVVNQRYEHWELCVADDGSTSKGTRRVLRRWQERDDRIRVKFRARNGHIVAASRTALAMAQGEWVALFDHDDVLKPESLLRMVLEMNRQPHACFLYSDEDKIDRMGQRFSPYFKPDWNPLLLDSQNYICHFAVIRRREMETVGGFRSGTDGVQDWDLFRRLGDYLPRKSILHIPEVLYHWRSLPGSTAHHIGEKAYVVEAGRQALDHEDPEGESANRELVAGMYWVRKYEPCHNYQILRYRSGRPDRPVEPRRNGNLSPAVVILLPEGVTEEPMACASLAGWADNPELGLVAGSLLREDGGVAEGGLLLQEDGGVRPILRDLDPHYEGMGRRELLPQNLLVPGRWFLALRRDLWEASKEDWPKEVLSWTHAVAIFSLRLVEKGYLHAFVPRIGIRAPVPSADQKRKDLTKTLEGWPKWCQADPGGNPNLTTEGGLWALQMDKKVPRDWSGP